MQALWGSRAKTNADAQHSLCSWSDEIRARFCDNLADFGKSDFGIASGTCLKWLSAARGPSLVFIVIQNTGVGADLRDNYKGIPRRCDSSH